MNNLSVDDVINTHNITLTTWSVLQLHRPSLSNMELTHARAFEMMKNMEPVRLRLVKTITSDTGKRQGELCLWRTMSLADTDSDYRVRKARNSYSKDYCL